MRKALLLARLSMMAVLVFAPAAMAQEFIDVPAGTRPCPFDLEEVAATQEEEVGCGEGGGYVLADEAGLKPSPAPDASASATASASPTATASATAEADDEELPATGGASPLVPMGAIALIRAADCSRSAW